MRRRWPIWRHSKRVWRVVRGLLAAAVEVKLLRCQPWGHLPEQAEAGELPARRSPLLKQGQCRESDNQCRVETALFSMLMAVSLARMVTFGRRTQTELGLTN